MDFRGKAIRLDSIDISRLAYTIGCGEDHLHAVMEVETRGGGFDAYGRLKALFEPHKFYSHLKGADRNLAVSKGLAYPRWGQKPYPRDSYPRIESAILIDKEAALKSTSWGLGQVLGENHDMLGYNTAEEMVLAMIDDEAVHLAGMVSFIIAAGLDDDLRREDWRGFARGYNGPGYHKHNYHGRLKASFEKWKRIPDTPFTPDMIDRSEPVLNPPQEPSFPVRGRMLKLGMRGEDVTLLQSLLRDLNYPIGDVDGRFGTLTKRAVIAFQLDNDLVPDGKVGEQTWAALDFASPAKPREQVEASDLRDRGSKTIRDVDIGQTVTAASIGAVGLDAILAEGRVDSLLDTAERLDQLNMLDRLLSWAQSNSLLLVGIIFMVAAMVYMNSVKKRRVEDHNKGMHLGR